MRYPGGLVRALPKVPSLTDATGIWTVREAMNATALGTWPGYTTAAVAFDGTNDYMTRGAALTGNADGKSGIVSVWLKFNGGDATLQWVYSNNGGFFSLYKDASNKIGIAGYNGAATEIMRFVTSNSYTAGATWRHVLAAWDLAAGTRQLYITDVSDFSSVTNTNDTIDYTRTDHAIGAVPAGTNKGNYDIADFYLALNTTLDLSVADNRRKFISPSGKPVNLGSNGSLPTGSQPIIFCRCAPGAAASTFATNLGSGGNFTVAGALTAASTSPSD